MAVFRREGDALALQQRVDFGGVRGRVDPSRVLKLRQQVTVAVTGVDLERKRISLRLVK